MEILLILGIALLVLKTQSAKKSSPNPAGERIATVNDVIQSTIAGVTSVVGRIQSVTNYGTSQGMSESEINQVSPGDTAAANPQAASKLRTSNRGVRTGATSISGRSNVPTVFKKAITRSIPTKSRTQSKGVVPYNPYARPSGISRIKALMQ
jgi:hypothetical protein